MSNYYKAFWGSEHFPNIQFKHIKRTCSDTNQSNQIQKYLPLDKATCALIFNEDAADYNFVFFMLFVV